MRGLFTAGVLDVLGGVGSAARSPFPVGGKPPTRRAAMVGAARLPAMNRAACYTCGLALLCRRSNTALSLLGLPLLER